MAESQESRVLGQNRPPSLAVTGDRTEKVIEFGMRPFRKPVRPQKVVVVHADLEKITQEGAAEATKPTT